MMAALTPADIANTIRMMRSRHAGAILIVEGGDDVRFYERFIDREKCRLVPALGNAAAKEVLSILEAEGFTGLLAVLDQDFSAIEGQPASANIGLTDVHDLECLLIASPALDKVVGEFGSKEKVAGKNVREILLSSGEWIGCLRLISLRRGLELTFEGLTYSDFINKKELTVDVPALVRSVKNKSGKHGLDEVTTVAEMGTVIGRYDRWLVCCGHDLVELLCIGLRRAFGSCKAVIATSEVIGRSLRLAYEASHFAMTQLYRSIKTWESSNNPYVVLARA